MGIVAFRSPVIWVGENLVQAKLFLETVSKKHGQRIRMMGTLATSQTSEPWRLNGISHQGFLTLHIQRAAGRCKVNALMGQRRGRGCALCA